MNFQQKQMQGEEISEEDLQKRKNKRNKLKKTAIFLS